ncbi:MAG: hypothetical protein ACOC78_00605 [Actinomycetota bacterium]
MAYREERGFEPLDGYSTPIDKGIVLESFKAACLFVGWARSIEERAAGSTVWDEADEELEVDLERWSFLETLNSEGTRLYEQIDDPTLLMAIMASLELALLLSANKDEVFHLRREWQKLGRWMKVRYGADPTSEGRTYIEAAQGEIMPLRKALYLLVEHMPELKQGWNEGGAEGLKDYMLVLWLSSQKDHDA